MRLNSEKIILEVQKFPVLYNTRDTNFRNRTLKVDIWRKVTEAVVGERYWHSDQLQRCELAKAVQKKWKCIKEAYIRTLKIDEGKDEDEASKRRPRPYVYYHQLSFLGPFLKNRVTNGNTEDTSVTEDIEEQLLETTESPPFFQNLKHKRKKEDLETQLIKVLKEFTEQNQSPLTLSATDSDADKMFLLSLLPKIKLLTPDAAFDFQIKVMQLLQFFMSDDANFKD